MSATCLHHFYAIITCDGLGLTETMQTFGPYTSEASALAHVHEHGAVCTGMGQAGVATGTCQAQVYDMYQWRDV